MISKKNHRVRKQSETLYIAALRERKRTSPTTDDLVERPLAIEEAVALFHPPVGGYMLVRRVWWRALHGRRPRFEYFKPLKQIKIKQGRKEARISSEVPPEISRFQGKASVDQLVESDLSTPPACRPSASTPASGRSRSRNVIKNELFNFWLSFCGLYLVDAGSPPAFFSTRWLAKLRVQIAHRILTRPRGSLTLCRAMNQMLIYPKADCKRIGLPTRPINPI